jgi:uncharacterized membrane protein YecN with MAPEG domain
MIIISITAALLAFLFIVLSFRVIKLRRSRRVAIGAGGDAALERAMRVHANFAEYVPFALVLLILCALRGLPDVLLAALCAVLFLGRAVHAYGVSQVKEDFRLRVAGMMATFGVIGSSALALLVLTLRG